MKWIQVFLCTLPLSLFAETAMADWTEVNTGITNNFIYTFAIGEPGLLTGTGGGGVFYSTTGSQWTSSNSGLTDLNVQVLNSFLENDYAGTPSGIFISNNNGGSWAPSNSGLTTTNVYSLAYTSSNVFYAGTSTGGVFKSTDAGASWAPANTGLTSLTVNAMAVSGLDVYAGTSSGLFKTTNAGASWFAVNNGLSNTFINTLYRTGTTFYAGTNGGAFRSTDGGANWMAINNGLTNMAITGFAAQQTNLWVSNYAGVFFSTDNGANWTAANTGLGNLNVYTLQLFDQYLYAGTLGGGIYRRLTSEFVGGGGPIVPRITSFTPASGEAGTEVIITGTGFSGSLQGTVVRFGSALASASDVTATSITVQAPTNATYGPISVTTSNLSALSDDPFFVTFGGGGFGSSSFASPTPTGITGSTFGVLNSDIDNDGKLDLVLLLQNGMRVARNTTTTIGNFSFGSPVDFDDMWFGSKGFAIGDLDGDGRVDVAIANGDLATIGKLSVFRNTSTTGRLDSTSFASVVNLEDTTEFFSPQDVAFADFDKDGRPDIAVTAQQTLNGLLEVFRNVSAPGSLTLSSFKQPVKVLSGSIASKVNTADFDGDGMVDAAVLSFSGGGYVLNLFRNTTVDSAISFASPITLSSLPASTVDVFAGDINADGKPEIITTSAPGSANGIVKVFENGSVVGDITFLPPVTLNLSSPGSQVQLADIDGDAKPDIVIKGNNRMMLFRNMSDGGLIETNTFSPIVNVTGFSTFTNAYLAVADVDGDAKPEVTLAGGSSQPVNVSIFRNRVSTGFTPMPIETGTTEDLEGVSFVDADHGAIAGGGGVVRRTTDGGGTWTGSNTGTTVDLTDIELVGGRGFITGSDGFISLSTDGGANWTQFTTGTTETFNGCSFSSEAAGWAVGTGGAIYAYNGTGWGSQSSGTTAELKSVFALGSSGWAVGANGTIRKYDGANWVSQTSGITEALTDVAFADANSGIAVGLNSTVSKTTDGGTTWTPINIGFTGLDIRSIRMANASIGWATADGGVVLQTEDGGTTWSVAYLGTMNLRAVDFVDNQGIIVGDGGVGYAFETTLLSVQEGKNAVQIPTTFVLEQNYPNPFNPTTTIGFKIHSSENVSLKVYDLLGREVRTLMNERLPAGSYETTLDGSGLATGIYFYRLDAGGVVQTRKMLLLK